MANQLALLSYGFASEGNERTGESGWTERQHEKELGKKKKHERNLPVVVTRVGQAIFYFLERLDHAQNENRSIDASYVWFDENTRNRSIEASNLHLF